MVYSPTPHWHDAKRRHHPPGKGHHGEAHRIIELLVLSDGALAYTRDSTKIRVKAAIGPKWSCIAALIPSSQSFPRIAFLAQTWGDHPEQPCLSTWPVLSTSRALVARRPVFRYTLTPSSPHPVQRSPGR